MRLPDLPPSNWGSWRRVRQAVQVLSFALYVYLLFAALQHRSALSMADLFPRLDLLAALAAQLASRSLIPRLYPALATLVVTLLLGRVWCGWLCPLGTLLEWVRFGSARRREGALSPSLRRVKNSLLLLILAAAVFGNLTLLAADPLTILTRSATTVLLPALNRAVTSVESLLYANRWLGQVILDPLERLLRGSVLPVEQPLFYQNVPLGLLFAGVLALNLLADRFWCHFVCPLGALLGWLSRVAILRPVLGKACSRCARCADTCRVGAVDLDPDYAIVPSECTVCLDCLAACPEQGAGFRWHLGRDGARTYDPTRRQLLAALASAAAGTVLMRSSAESRVPDARVIRPPGAQQEERFLSRCLRCSQCMKVCPTSGLQPCLMEGGLEGLWTPRLVPRLGYCDYGCNACGQACPSGAIPRLSLAEKRATVIGLAAVDRDRCLPWAYGIPCIVCEEMCPRPEKAIRLEQVTVKDGQGQEMVLQRPYVRQDLCIGCGICERKCPQGGNAAIQVWRY